MKMLFAPWITRFSLIILLTIEESTAVITEETMNMQDTTESITFNTSTVEDFKEEDADVCEAGKTGHECFIDQLLVLGNNMYLRPYFEGPAVNDTCNIFVNSISEINEASMDYQITIFLHQRWNDDRLKHNYDTITLQSLDLINRIWRPDTYFDNEKKATFHKVTMDNVAMQISQNGDIFYSLRLSLKVYCNMNLRTFPFDSHQCPLVLLSYAYHSEELKLRWQEKDAVKFYTYYQLPQFSLDKIETRQFEEDYGGLTKWSFLEVRFFWTRQTGYFVLQTYIPSGLLVSISWISFWLSADATPARTVLGITTILTITTQSAWARESLPQVSYATAIDVWMAGCVCFVFLALLEFAAVNFVHGWIEAKREETERQRTRIKNMMRNMNVAMGICQPKPNITDEGNDTKGKREEPPHCNNNGNEIQPDSRVEANRGEAAEKQKKRNMPNTVDRISRVLFPLSFIFFNTVYWWYYLT